MMAHTAMVTAGLVRELAPRNYADVTHSCHQPSSNSTDSDSSFTAMSLRVADSNRVMFMFKKVVAGQKCG